MSRCLLALVVVTAGVPDTAFGAFKTCNDARQYGWNSSQMYVGQALKKLACVPQGLDRTIDALAVATQKQVLPTQDSDEEKQCFFVGYYSGLLQRTSVEFSKCTTFSCIDWTIVARYAASTFIAMFKSLNDIQSLDAATIKSILSPQDKLPDPPVVLCNEINFTSCITVVQSMLQSELDGLTDEQLSFVVDAVCRST